MTKADPKRILIADDREQNRYLLRSILESQGWVCEEASDGAEALALALANPPDLLITDVLMPQMDGFSLCRLWKKEPRLREIPLVFISSTFNTTRDEKLALNLGADLFLNYPLLPDKLSEQVQQLLSARKEQVAMPSGEVSTQDVNLIEEHVLTLASKLEKKVEELEESNRELHQTLRALQKAESGRDQFKGELEQFLTLSPDYIFMVNQDLELLEVNPAWEHLPGLNREELLGRNILDFIYEEDRAPAEAHFKTTFTSEESSQLRVRIQGVGIDPVWIEFHLAAFFEKRLFGIGHDVTRQKEALEQLQLLNTALKAAALGVVITKRDGTIMWTNPAFEAICGYSQEELLGNSLGMVRSDQHSEAFYREIWDIVEAGKVWKGEAISKRKDGQLYNEETVITPMKDEQGEVVYYIAFKEDITERKRQDRQLVRSQRMESIGHLAGGLAHDLNNVLAPIALSIEMLRKGEDSPGRQSMLQIMERSCERGAEIIRQVLTFARGVEGERVPLQLRHLVQELVIMIGETFPPDIHVIHDFPRDLWPVLADATQIHQVLLNLAVNARDAMPHGGDLRILAKNLEINEQRENLNLYVEPGKYVRVSVMDTGQGISEKDMDQIFEPFFTTKAEGRGTGLGLPSVLGILRSHGGLLEVKSKVGEGTTVLFLLPVAESPVAADTEIEGPDIPRGRGETILVVDDEPSVLQITEAILEEAGYRFLGARNGAEGVALYASHSDEIAMVLTDVIMPVMNGSAMTASLKRINPEVKVVGSSGYTEDSGVERVNELRELGVKIILKKPFGSEKLLWAIHKTLHGTGTESPFGAAVGPAN